MEPHAFFMNFEAEIVTDSLIREILTNRSCAVAKEIVNFVKWELGIVGNVRYQVLHGSFQNRRRPDLAKKEKRSMSESE